MGTHCHNSTEKLPASLNGIRGDRKIGQGRDAVKEAFKADPEFAAEVEAKVREALAAAG